MNVPTMTVGKSEEEKKLDRLKAENEDLRAQCKAYEAQLQRCRESEERAFMRGKIEGLLLRGVENGV